MNRYLSPHSTLSLVLVCGVLLLPAAHSADAQSIEPDSAPGGAAATAAVARRPRTVTVLPFSNISGAADDEWIGTGIAETVTVGLEPFDALSVIDRAALLDVLTHSEVTPTSTNDALAREVALDLGVAWLVTGGFQRLGDQMRVTARIVNTETGASSTAVKVDGRLDQLFDLQDQLVDELSDGFATIAGTSPAGPVIAARDTASDPTALAEGAGVDSFSQPTPPRGRGQRQAGQGRGRGAGRRAGNGGAPAAAFPSTTGGNVTGDTGDVANVVTGGLTIDAGGEATSSAGPMAGNAGALAGRITVRPVRTETPPDVDGRIDDAVWRDAARITDFVQRQPTDGAPATEATDVYIAYDSSTIYLAFHAHYTDPSIMRANRTDRDQAVGATISSPSTSTRSSISNGPTVSRSMATGSKATRS